MPNHWFYMNLRDAHFLWLLSTAVNVVTCNKTGEGNEISNVKFKSTRFYNFYGKS